MNSFFSELGISLAGEATKIGLDPSQLTTTLPQDDEPCSGIDCWNYDFGNMEMVSRNAGIIFGAIILAGISYYLCYVVNENRRKH